MELYEFNTDTFVVKIWLEETMQESGRATWRGHITHVPSGERRYFEELCDVIVFIVPYLERMEVKLDRGRVRRWLGRCKSYLRSL